MKHLITILLILSSTQAQGAKYWHGIEFVQADSPHIREVAEKAKCNKLTAFQSNRKTQSTRPIDGDKPVIEVMDMPTSKEKMRIYAGR